MAIFNLVLNHYNLLIIINFLAEILIYYYQFTYTTPYLPTQRHQSLKLIYLLNKKILNKINDFLISLSFY